MAQQLPLNLPSPQIVDPSGQQAMTTLGQNAHHADVFSRAAYARKRQRDAEGVALTGFVTESEVGQYAVRAVTAEIQAAAPGLAGAHPLIAAMFVFVLEQLENMLRDHAERALVQLWENEQREFDQILREAQRAQSQLVRDAQHAQSLLVRDAQHAQSQLLRDAQHARSLRRRDAQHAQSLRRRDAQRLRYAAYEESLFWNLILEDEQRGFDQILRDAQHAQSQLLRDAQHAAVLHRLVLVERDQQNTEVRRLNSLARRPQDAIRSVSDANGAPPPHFPRTHGELHTVGEHQLRNLAVFYGLNPPNRLRTIEEKNKALEDLKNLLGVRF